MGIRPYLCIHFFSMKQAATLFLIVLSLCFGDANSYAQKSTLLRLHLKKGENFKITSHTNSKMVMMRNGRKLPVNQTYTSEYLLSVLEIRPNGNIVIGAMLDQFAMKMKVKGITSLFDIRKTKIEGMEGLRMYIQAKNFIGSVKLKKGDMPPVVDVEQTGNKKIC